MAGVVGNKGGGRTRKPTALKIIQGTLRPHRENSYEPQLPEPSLIPPIDLGSEEKSHWDELAPLLVQVRIMTEGDRRALARYCILMAQFVSIKRKLKRKPELLDLLLRVNVQIKAIETEFGLTPASRSRIHAQPHEKDNEEKQKERRFFS